MVKSPQSVGLDDEEATAADFRDPVQFSGLAYFCCPEGSSPTAPKVFFILTTNESLKVDSPNYVCGTHEVQCRKRNFDRRCPSVCADSCFRSPHSVPPRIAVLCTAIHITDLFIGYQRIPLRAQWIDLKHISVAAVMSGINHD